MKEGKKTFLYCIQAPIIPLWVDFIDSSKNFILFIIIVSFSILSLLAFKRKKKKEKILDKKIILLLTLLLLITIIYIITFYYFGNAYSLWLQSPLPKHIIPAKSINGIAPDLCM